MHGLRLAIAGLALSFAFALQSFALEIPPAPTDYVYDPSHTLDPQIKSQFTQLLSNADQKTGNQIVIALFPTLEGEDLVDYVNRIFKAWNPGQKGKDNGIVLAVFLKERKIRIEVGYGLEATLTDARTKRIIEEEIVPRFKLGHIPQGLASGVQRILQTIEDPNAQYDPRPRKQRSLPKFIFIGLVLIIFFILYGVDRMTSLSSTGGSTYYRRRRSPFWGHGGWGGGGSGWGGGGFGGGGFSGGGGSSGGGGASGNW